MKLVIQFPDKTDLKQLYKELNNINHVTQILLGKIFSKIRLLPFN